MKEIVVISGKGGTGKTSITAALACFGGKETVVADCDVDAADMHLLMKPDFGYEEDFYSGELAVIDQNLCIRCGKCQNACRFEAIEIKNFKYQINELSCEGCGYCEKICPPQAIKSVERLAGKWYISKIRTGSTMVHARLGIGAENSGKLVAKVKNEAREIALEERIEFVLIDGSPGIGCPVVSSLSGATLAVLVTEPTVSGFHDLKRVFELVKKFRIKAACIINKADLNADISGRIKAFLTQENIPLIAELPYNEIFTRAMIQGETIAGFGESQVKDILKETWSQIKKIAN
jgi:MinD superfamily P-loop ATPase